MTAQAGQSNRLPRATCPVCDREVALRVHGQLREHRVEGLLCPASGMSVANVKVLMEHEPDALRGATR